jgi:hypothetical protein
MEDERQLLRDILELQRKMLGEMTAMRRLLEQQNGTVAPGARKPEPVFSVSAQKEEQPPSAPEALQASKAKDRGGDDLVKALAKRNRMAREAIDFARRTKK